MKSKYERMTKKEKRELYLEYKKEKNVFAKKMEKMFWLCYAGIMYGAIMFIYDFFFKKSKVAFILDIVVLVFCVIAVLKIYSTKKELLNNYALKKDKVRKENIVKKYKK